MAPTIPSETTRTDWASALITGPHYEAPYPGAVQDELAWHLVKYLREDARLRSEVEVEIPATAPYGPALFTIDMVVEVPPSDDEEGESPRRVAFETATGRTLRDHDRRLRRDAALLAHGAVDTIYRLRGSDLMGRMDDVLYLASRWDPGVFSTRGRKNLETLASPEARAVQLRPEQPSMIVPYDLDDADRSAPERHLWHVANGQAPYVLVRRLDRRFPSVWEPYASR